MRWLTVLSAPEQMEVSQTMSGLKKTLQESPTAVRVVPFLVFLVFTAGQGQLGESSRYWMYAAKTLAGVGLIWLMRPYVAEMRWAISWEAVVVGVLVCVVWVGLDPFVPKQNDLWIRLGLIKPPVKPSPLWDPFTRFGDGSTWAWFYVTIRIFGSTFVVPPLEEVFYRSFVYRYLQRTQFDAVPLNTFAWLPFVVAAVFFGFAHNEWLAGILCAMAYQWLVIRKNRLGDAITAHAITNFLLGVWIVWKGAWHFW